MKKTFILTLLVAVFTIFSCKTNEEKPNINENNSETNRLARIDSLMRLSEESKNTNQIEEQTDKIINQAQSQTVIHDDDYYNRKYYLIVGSFQDYKNAAEILKEFKGAEVIQGGDNMNRVSIGTMTGLEEAVSAIRSFKAKYPEIPAWLYTK